MTDATLIGKHVREDGPSGSGLTEAELSEILGTQDIHVLPEGSIVTMDYNPRRARVWHDRDLKITDVTWG